MIVNPTSIANNIETIAWNRRCWVKKKKLSEIVTAAPKTITIHTMAGMLLCE